MKHRQGRGALAPLAASAALFLVAAASRPLIPIDETRYASVAWEMYARGDWIVPHLNGLPYSHKPPLLFWLILLGWSVLGAQAPWMRAVPALLSLANVALVARLARRLWPDEPRVASVAAWIFAAAGLPALFGTVVFFDPLLTTCVLVAVGAVLRASEGSRAWLGVYGIALGAGVLSKGPVVLVHALPVALLAPWWERAEPGVRRAGWYAAVAGSVVLGAALALAWALPAAHAGGPAYHDALLWGQTADRMVRSFAHRRPFWFYAPMLLVALAPWSAWPTLWKAGHRLLRGSVDRGLRFCLAWLVPGIVVLSLVSGKQPQYMLPLLPAIALAGARALCADGGTSRASRGARALPVAALAGVGALLIAAGRGALVGHAPAWTAGIPLWGGAALVGGAVALAAWPARTVLDEVPRLGLASLFFLVVMHAAVVPEAMATHDIRAVATLLGRLQGEGHPIAHAGTYHGQFQFLGKLQRPLDVVEPAELLPWANAHPDGYVVAYFDSWQPGASLGPEYVQPFRGQTVTVWSAPVYAAAARAGAIPGDRAPATTSPEDRRS